MIARAIPKTGPRRCRLLYVENHADSVALVETLNHRDGDAAAYRELELSRLDALLVACWPHASKGSAEHVRARPRCWTRLAFPHGCIAKA